MPTLTAPFYLRHMAHGRELRMSSIAAAMTAAKVLGWNNYQLHETSEYGNFSGRVIIDQCPGSAPTVYGGYLTAEQAAQVMA